MPIRSLPVVLLLLSTLLLSTLFPAAANELDPTSLAREIERLATLVDDPGLGEQSEGLRKVQREAAEASSLGQLHRALELLRSGLVAAGSYGYLAQHEQVQDLATFERLWSQSQRIPVQARAAATSGACRRGPAQVRALVEVAANRAGRHYRASRAMARASSPRSGLFYLGRAKAEAELGRLCEVFDPRATHPIAASPGVEPATLTAGLAELQEALDDAYADPDAAIERHAEFITLSALLKEVAELDDAGFHFGALDRLLEATLRSHRLQGGASEGLDRDSLRSQVERWTEILDADSRDHSIAAAYLERAAAALDDSETSDESLTLSRGILSHVLPTYRAWLGLPQP